MCSVRSRCCLFSPVGDGQIFCAFWLRMISVGSSIVKLNARTHLRAHDCECWHYTHEYDMYLAYKEMKNAGGTDEGFKPASSEFFRRVRSHRKWGVHKFVGIWSILSAKWGRKQNKPASSEFFRRLRVLTSTSKIVRGVVILTNHTWKYEGWNPLKGIEGSPGQQTRLSRDKARRVQMNTSSRFHRLGDRPFASVKLHWLCYYLRFRLFLNHFATCSWDNMHGVICIVCLIGLVGSDKDNCVRAKWSMQKCKHGLRRDSRWIDPFRMKGRISVSK